MVTSLPVRNEYKPGVMHTDKEKIIQFIQDIFPMPIQDATAIGSHFNEKQFNKNERVLKEGKICQAYYILSDGFMRAYTYDLDGNDVTTAFYSGSQVVCELFSFFKQVPSKENIQALTDCITWFITFNDLQKIFHSMPQFREFGRAILVNAYADLKQRMLATLHETAEERYGKLIVSKPSIFQHVPLKNIASYLGITDTSLSRIRKEFSKK
jgi:CRP-like cAMP-binding protein